MNYQSIQSAINKVFANEDLTEEELDQLKQVLSTNILFPMKTDDVIALISNMSTTNTLENFKTITLEVIRFGLSFGYGINNITESI